MWKVNKDFIKQTIETSKECIASGDALGVLECIGILCFVEQSNDTNKIIENTDSFSKMANKAIENLDGEEIDDAAAEFLKALNELDTCDNNDRDELEERIIDTLNVRDVAELIITGAQHLGYERKFTDDFISSVIAFNELIEPELFRLIPFNVRREARFAWAAPSYRKRIWWWQRGADIPTNALDALGTTARIIHLFPEARAELERLIHAESTIEKITK